MEDIERKGYDGHPCWTRGMKIQLLPYSTAQPYVGYPTPQEGRQRMTLQRLYPRPAFETPIEIMFRRIVKRPMTKEERKWFHLRTVPRTRVRS